MPCKGAFAPAEKHERSLRLFAGLRGLAAVLRRAGRALRGRSRTARGAPLLPEIEPDPARQFALYAIVYTPLNELRFQELRCQSCHS